MVMKGRGKGVAHLSPGNTPTREPFRNASVGSCRQAALMLGLCPSHPRPHTLNMIASYRIPRSINLGGTLSGVIHIIPLHLAVRAVDMRL